MNKKKIIKWVLIAGIILVVIGGSVALYMFNMPHRDVQNTKTDFTINASDIVAEYLSNADIANEKYLDEDGESRILEISGVVSKIEEDFEKNMVVLLKSENDKAGVSCTFLLAESEAVNRLNIGDQVVVKGVIRAGAAFDEDLDMYEHVIVEKSALVSKI